jgi:endoglucanase
LYKAAIDRLLSEKVMLTTTRGIRAVLCFWLSFICVSACSETYTPQEEQAAFPQQPLSVYGEGAGVSQASNPIESCINLGGALEAGYEGEWGYIIEDAHLKKIADAGFGTVRVPINWAGHTRKSAPYIIDEAFFSRVDHVVDTALAEGLQVIINVHHYNKLMDRPIEQMPRFAAIWRQIAERYKDYPETVIFEVLNEPYGEMTERRLASANFTTLEIIRKTNPSRWVIFSGVQWGNFEGLIGMNFPKDPKTMLTFHYYDPFEFTHQGAGWTSTKYKKGQDWGSDEDVAKFKADIGNLTSHPIFQSHILFLGEFGAIRHAAPQARFEYIKTVREFAAEYDVGWCYWDFVGEFKAYDLETESWIPEVKSALLGNQ